MRIDIVGLPAAGKSTLAEAISKKLSIPHIHLDRFWFESGGHISGGSAPTIQQVRARVRDKATEALKAESWVSDGTYLHIQDLIAAQADQIIFLDIPLWRRLVSHGKRMLHPRERHKETSFWDDVLFFGEIIKRTFTKASKLRRFINEHKNKVLILRSHKEIDAYLERLS
ncbi:MAG: hypothetical protein WAN50_05065 [Minisyncoccia bacterium]